MFIFHSKPNSTRSRVTVVGKQEGNQLKIATARCSRNDQFSRKIGRELAAKRIENNQLYISIPVEQSDIALFLLVAQGISTNVLQSKRVIR